MKRKKIKKNFKYMCVCLCIHLYITLQSLQSRRSAPKKAIRAQSIGINFIELTSCGSGALGPLGFLVCCTIFTGSLPSLIAVGSSSMSVSSCCGSISEYKSGNLGISK